MNQPTPPPLAPGLRRMVLGGVALIAVVSTVALAFSPWLLIHAPLLLVALNPEGRHIILASAEAAFVPLMVVGCLRRWAALLLTWGVGAAYGQAAVNWLLRKSKVFARFIHWSARLLQRTGPAILIVVPGYTITMLAGVAGLSFRRCATALGLGVLWLIPATIWVGSSLRDWIRPFLAWLSANVVEATVVTLVLFGGWKLFSKLRGKDGNGLGDLPLAPDDPQALPDPGDGER